MGERGLAPIGDTKYSVILAVRAPTPSPGGEVLLFLR